MRICKRVRVCTYACLRTAKGTDHIIRKLESEKLKNLEKSERAGQRQEQARGKEHFVRGHQRTGSDRCSSAQRRQSGDREAAGSRFYEQDSH